MKQIIELVLTVMLFTSTSVVFAQDLLDVLVQENESPEYPAKLEYDRTQALPDGIAFEGALILLTHFDDSGQRFTATSLLQDKLKMDEAGADAFLTQLLTTNQTMVQDVESAQSAHACSPGDAYILLDQLYDVSEEIYSRHYDETKSGLDRVTATRLDSWLSELKAATVYTRIDFEKVDLITGKDSTRTISDLCKESK